jgi:hypothetical protein
VYIVVSSSAPVHRKGNLLFVNAADPAMAALEACFDDYNSTGLAAEQLKYKLPEPDQNILKNLIFGVAPTVLVLLKGHLDEYKEEFAGAVKLKMTDRRRSKTVPPHWIASTLGDPNLAETNHLRFLESKLFGEPQTRGHSVWPEHPGNCK